MQAQPLTLTQLESWIDERRKETDTPGAAVVLAHKGETLLSRGFGFRDSDAGLAADADTVFGAASITKAFTALAILLLEEDGRLAVNDPATAYLPDLRLPGPYADKVTIQHLLTHTSGLPPLPSRHYAWLSQDDLEAFERAGLERWPPHAPLRSYDDLIAFLSDHPFELHARPGEAVSYSNEGFNLLGAIVERVSAQPLSVLLHDRILAPLGMSRSSLDLEFTLGLPNVTKLYIRRGGSVLTSRNWYNPACWAAAGGLRTTANDLARYFSMLAAGGVLDGVRIASPESVRKMTTAYAVKADGSHVSCGLGLRDRWGYATAGHSGGQKGVSTFACFAPAQALVCVVMTNLQGGPVGKIWNACARTALGLPPEPLSAPPKPVEIPVGILRSYAGRYVSGEGVDFDIIANDAGEVHAWGAPLIPTAHDALTFVGPDGGETTLRFTRLRGGDVSHAVLGGRLVKRVGPPRPRPAELASFDPSHFDKYAGHYFVDRYPGLETPAVFTVSRADGRFFAQITDLERVEIHPETETRFFAKTVNSQIRFCRDAEGNVTHIIQYDQEHERTFWRIDPAVAKGMIAARRERREGRRGTLVQD